MERVVIVEDKRQINRARLLRLGVMLLGLIIITLAIGANKIGIAGEGITLGKISVALSGLMILLSAWVLRPQDFKDQRALVKRMVNLYQGLAILVLNTLLLLIGLELGARVWPQLVGAPGQPALNPALVPANMPYYQAQDWGRQYWQDFRWVGGEFVPYVLWRGVPLASPTINIDEQGLRQTPGVDCSAKAYKVFVFGGSTMWGDGSPDWGTIPAYLLPGLQAARDEPVCIVNFAQPGFISTQSLIVLLGQLYSGNIPDLVIFYDGINDVYGAYRSGQAGAQRSAEEIAQEFNGNHLVKYLKNSASFKLFQKIGSDEQITTYQTKNIAIDTLSDSVVQVYFGNYDIVETMAQYYSFDYLFFLQPALPLGEKPLTPLEQMIKDEIDPALVSLYAETYQKIKYEAPKYQHFYDISDVLDDQTASLWFDSYHITPEGNQLVAQKIFEITSKQLMEK